MSEVIYNFSGKRFVITGASSGMGRQISIELAQAGAIVMAIARGEAKLQELQTLYPLQIQYTVCDVTNRESLEIAVRDFVSKNGKIHGSVHAAGILGLTPIRLFDEKLAHNIMDISFWAGVNLLQIVTKNKYSEAGMANVLFSSAGGHNAAKGMFAYASAKAAMQVAVRSIAKEIAGKGHRINTVSPGWIKTHMTEIADKTTDVQDIVKKHLLGEGAPEDVSGVVLFLLSDRGKWITGTDIVVDGGYLA